MSDLPQPQTDTLYFKELNTDQDQSIIFLHGGSGSHIEWNAVADQPALASYHLLLVDLPGHSASRNIGPCSLDAAADSTQKVIRQYAHGGKAHVVGFSLGAFIALALTAQYPDCVLSTFASGAYPYRGFFKWAMARPKFMWLLNSIEIPGLTAMTLRMQGIDNDEWIEETKKNTSWERSKVVMKDLSEFGMDNVRAVAKSGVRTCVVAGGKMDQVDAVKDMGQLLHDEGKVNGVVNEAFVVRRAYHPWHLQLPTLFANGVDAWVRGVPLPDEFETLIV